MLRMEVDKNRCSSRISNSLLNYKCLFLHIFMYQLYKKDLEVLLNLGESQAHRLADSRQNTLDQNLLFS